MTTNKTEVVAWLNDSHHEATLSAHVAEAWRDLKKEVEPLIRLSDYEALQAECEALREALFEAQATMTSALSFGPFINEVTLKTLGTEVERIKSLLSEGGNKS